MCILFMFIDPAPQENRYRFIAASNRDEFYRRPSQPVSRQDHVIGGRDLESGRAGGMWLGVSLQRLGETRFRFGALLNVTGEERKESKGRGSIVADYLHGTATADLYIDGLLGSTEPYNAFNFVATEIRQGETITTAHCSNTPSTRTVNRGDERRFLGFGNTIPSAQLTKVKRGTTCFEQVVDECNDVARRAELIERLLSLLKNEERQLPDEVLEARQPNAFRQLSCIYVRIADVGYGTRTHSIVLVDHEWNVEFHEATMEEPICAERPVWKTNVIKARL